MEIFITSDLHYNHKNICGGESTWEDKDGTRSFQTVQEMNAAIVDNINRLVAKTDKLFVLGDVIMSDNVDPLIEQLNVLPENIIIVLGNHDKWKTHKFKDKLKIVPYLETTIIGQKICMSHYRPTKLKQSCPCLNLRFLASNLS